MGEVLRHPLFVATLAPLVVAFAVGVVGLLRRIAGTASKMESYVLPHFVPTTTGTTMPESMRGLRHDLVEHMRHEEELRATEIQRRDSWRQEIDHRFDKIDERLG